MITLDGQIQHPLKENKNPKTPAEKFGYRRESSYIYPKLRL